MRSVRGVHPWSMAVLLLAGGLVGMTAGPGAAGLPGILTTRASLDVAGGDADGESFRPSMSANGRYVAFESEAADLVVPDTNGFRDLFVRDLMTGTTVRASVSPSGADPDGVSQQASVSSTGRYVAFLSFASNLVDGDDNGLADVFVRDLWVGTTVRAGVDVVSTEWELAAPSISGDGRYVGFVSLSALTPDDRNQLPDVYVRDLLTGTLARASVGLGGEDADGWSTSPFLNGDGRYVLFLSSASNLVADDGDTYQNLFVRDMVMQTTIRVDVDPAGGPANGHGASRPSISADGRYVAFPSYASNLVPGDGNGYQDIFRRDLFTGTTERVSVNWQAGDADRWSQSTSISADGRYVAFRSKATNIVRADRNRYNDVFVRDMVLGRTVRVSVDMNGGDADWNSFNPSISSQGLAVQVAFVTAASDIVPDDGNGVQDVFVRAKA